MLQMVTPGLLYHCDPVLMKNNRIVLIFFSIFLISIYSLKKKFRNFEKEFLALVAPVCTLGPTFTPPPTGLWFGAEIEILTENQSFEKFMIACYNSDEK